MTTVDPMRVLLLVEDNQGDADFVRELLAAEEGESFDLLHAPSLAPACDLLDKRVIDVVLLDLRLPDSTGVETVRAIRLRSRNVPIVVLSGIDDEEIGIACIECGAQDFLLKGELRARNLRRAIGYALNRMREAQQRELQFTLENYRALSTATQTTTVTATMAGSGAVALRHPSEFSKIVGAYSGLFDPLLRPRPNGSDPMRPLMERIARAICNLNGGPRDLLDAHVAALDRIIADHGERKILAIVAEARLLALEMMGLLVDCYRMGVGRISSQGAGE